MNSPTGEPGSTRLTANDRAARSSASAMSTCPPEEFRKSTTGPLRTLLGIFTPAIRLGTLTFRALPFFMVHLRVCGSATVGRPQAAGCRHTASHRSGKAPAPPDHVPNAVHTVALSAEYCMEYPLDAHRLHAVASRGDEVDRDREPVVRTYVLVQAAGDQSRH